MARDLGPEDMSQEARTEQWHAVNKQLVREQGAAAEPVRAPRTQALLPADGAGCIELLINSLSAIPNLSASFTQRSLKSHRTS